MVWLSVALTLVVLMVVATTWFTKPSVDRIGHVSDEWIAHHRGEVPRV